MVLKKRSFTTRLHQWRGWLCSLLIGVGLSFACPATANISAMSHTEQNEEERIENDQEHRPDITPEELEKLYNAYKNEQQTNNLIIYVGIFFAVIAVATIAFLVYTLRVRMRVQHSMQELESARQSFFTNVAHEFRTPLTVILGITDGLKKRLADRKTSAGFDLIIRQCNEMLSLVNQLLYVSSVRSVVEMGQWRTGDIVALLRMVVETVRLQIGKENIDLAFTTSSDSIKMDFVPEYMQRLLQGLITTIVRNTPDGGKISIAVSVEKKIVNITFTDSDTEIFRKDIPYLFEPFHLGNNSSDNNLRTGVELSMVRQMAETMDGHIVATQEGEKGVMFRLTFPQRHADGNYEQWQTSETSIPDDIPAISESPVEEVEEEKPTNENLNDLEDNATIFIDDDMRQSTVLVVEDNADIARYIGAVLDNRYRLLFARDGKEGLAKAEEQMPDLIMTDLMMPEMDGYELCRTVRASNILNHIPLIMVTARSEERDRLQGLEAGADAYLIKPFSADELKILVSKLLEQRRLLRKKFSQALREGRSESVEISEADRDFMARLHNTIFANISDTTLNSESLAVKLFMSKSQLNRKIKSITGLDTASYIRQTRVSFGKKLLITGELPIGDIAQQCGFESPSYFAKTFGQYYGMTPTQYRKQQQNEKS